MTTRLLVIVPDRISQILDKGEYQPRYYNPGGLFDEVHLLMTNDDRPDVGSLQQTVGDAELVLHNYPEATSLVGGGLEALRNWRLQRWGEGGVRIARRIAPCLVRCHGADWNSYLASRIRRRLGVPYLVSLHTNPDVAPPRRHRGEALTPEQRRHNRFYDYLEREALLNADLVMPVYEPVVPYLRRLGVTRYEVCYNVLDGGHLRVKADYSLGDPVRIISVGRLFSDKYPDHLIEAVAQLPGVRLDIVGDGPMRAELEALVSRLGVADRVRFEPAVLNRELCERLHGYDLFAVHTQSFEISKSVLEAVLSGLPVVINRRIGEPVPELEGDFVHMVDNTVEGYRGALERLIGDDAYRESLGRRAGAHARERWAPEKTEAKYAEIYRRFMLPAPPS